MATPYTYRRNSSDSTLSNTTTFNEDLKNLRLKIWDTIRHIKTYNRPRFRLRLRLGFRLRTIFTLSSVSHAAIQWRTRGTAIHLRSVLHAAVIDSAQLPPLRAQLTTSTHTKFPTITMETITFDPIFVHFGQMVKFLKSLIWIYSFSGPDWPTHAKFHYFPRWRTETGWNGMLEVVY